MSSWHYRQGFHGHRVSAKYAFLLMLMKVVYAKQVLQCRFNLTVTKEYSKKQLTWPTNWQHWGLSEYITALEPGTNPPVGQCKAREQNQLIPPEPDESRSYELRIAVLTQKEKIREFSSIIG
ncbi:MAG: DUF4432 family protein [Phycisphaerae bacterium]|jgi:hypothetical protein